MKDSSDVPLDICPRIIFHVIAITATTLARTTCLCVTYLKSGNVLCASDNVGCDRNLLSLISATLNLLTPLTTNTMGTSNVVEMVDTIMLIYSPHAL